MYRVSIIYNAFSFEIFIILLFVIKIINTSLLNHHDLILKQICNKTIFKVPNNSTEKLCQLPSVSITLSALSSRYYRLSWLVENYTEGDWVGMFNENPVNCNVNEGVIPTLNMTTFLHKIHVYNRTGSTITHIQELPKYSDDLGYSNRCLKFWIAYVTSNGTITALSCLKTSPTWMYDMRQYLKDVQLKQMFIPGTHDAGAYISYNSVLSNQNIVEKYIFTQDEDVLGQLIHGVRYLDLRVSSYTSNPSNERWWINHGLYRVHPLKDILNDIKIFIRSTKEIVIMDLHEFPVGFQNNDEAHRELISYLKFELSDLFATPDWSATCGQLWFRNRTLIISYNNEKMVKEFSTMLWPAVVHKWANAQNIHLLKDYLDDVIKKRPMYSWSAMAELTPTAWSILTYKSKGLREMAEEINPIIGSWFKGEWGRTCNIVAVDFVRSTDIVNTAIRWNLKRAHKTSCDYGIIQKEDL